MVSSSSLNPLDGFKVNTGCREQEVCGLRWDYEVRVPELETSVFVIPGGKVKNGQDRLVVLNRIARSVIESQRGLHRDFVFTYSPPERGAAPESASKSLKLRVLN